MAAVLEKQTPKRVLVTGINGFTGQHLRLVLQERGYQVIGTAGSASIGLAEDIRVMDLRDVDSVNAVVRQIQPDFVVHLAAVSFVGHGDVNAFYQVNLLGTRNLLQALARLEKKPEAVLLASSANVYGNAQEGKLCEQATVMPANDYAVSKLAMEHMARLWQEMLPIVVARPFNYTGVGQDERFLIPKIVRHFRERSPMIELGNLDVWRDFSDVRAVVRAYADLLKQPAAIGRTVNICSGTTWSLREVLARCESITGHRIEVQVNSAFVRSGEVRSLCGDSSLLQALVPGWQPIEFEQTLCWMLED